MPRPKAVRKTVANKTRKQAAIGSARKEAKVAEKPSGKGAARGIQGKGDRKPGPAPIHAKKEPPQPKPKAGQVAVGTPNVPGYTNFLDAEKYGAMKDILLGVIPTKAPGITQGEMFDAVHANASKAKFPGSTSRWWAKSVQLDLESKGVLRRIESTPLRWYRT